MNDVVHRAEPEQAQPTYPAVESGEMRPIEQLPLNERAAAYEHELEQLRGVLEGTDTELDFEA